MSLLILAVPCVMLLNGAKPSCAHYFVWPWDHESWKSAIKQISQSNFSFFKCFESSYQIDLIHKSYNTLVLYPKMHNSEQKCAQFPPTWCIVGYGTWALRDLWDCDIDLISYIISQLQCEMSNASEKILELSFACKMTSQWFLTILPQT